MVLGARVLKPRIPIFDTVGYGFFFGLSRYFSILRVAWLPLLPVALLVAFQIQLGLRANRGELESVELPMYLQLLGSIPFYVMLSIPAVVAYRMVMFGQPAPKGLAYFKFGATELQFVASQLVTSVYMIIYVLLAMLVVVPLALGAYYMFGPGEVLSMGAVIDDLTTRMRIGSGARAAIFVLSFFGVVFFSMVPAIVVSEHRIQIFRSIRLLWLGNVLRLAVVWAIVTITFLYLTTAASKILQTYGPSLLRYAMPDMDPSNFSHLLIGWSALILVPVVLGSTLLIGVTAGINGYAYRVLMSSQSRERGA